MVSEQEDEFQLVPKQELEALRKEVQELKSNPVQDYQSSLTLIESMDRLADQLTQLLQLFERANNEMYQDYQKGLHADSEKLDQVIAQNEKIAKGILALADHHGARQTDSSQPSQPEPQPANQQMQQPQSPPPGEEIVGMTHDGPDPQGEYPLSDMPSAPWNQQQEGSSEAPKSRRRLVREFQ